MRHGEGRRLGRGSPGGGSRDQFTQQTDDTPQSSVGPLDHLGSHLRRLRCPKCSSQMIQDERAVQRQAARIGAEDQGDQQPDDAEATAADRHPSTAAHPPSATDVADL